MVFGIISSAITSLAAFAFPIFASYKAIKADDASQLVPWLMFWSTQACWLFVEHWVYFLLQWVPFYREIKMLFTLWMVLPQTQGATYLYLHYLHPQIAQHEQDLDELILIAHDQIKTRGGQYVEMIVDKVYEILFGPTQRVASKHMRRSVSGITAHNIEQLDTEVGREGYIASLFSRFRTVPVGSTAESIPSSLFGFYGAASRRGTDIIPANLSPEERSRYVQQQRAKLQEWLHMLEVAEKSYPPIILPPSHPNSPGSQRTRESGTRSESGARTPTNAADSDYEDLGKDESLRSSRAGSRTSSWFWKTRVD